MLKKIWKQIKNDCLSIVKPDVEVGCNIYFKDFGSFYIDDIAIGSDKGVFIDVNPFVVGTFHTHVDSDIESWGFSPTDIKSAIENGERYMFLMVDKEVFASDLSKYSKSILSCIRGEISVSKLCDIINKYSLIL